MDAHVGSSTEGPDGNAVSTGPDVPKGNVTIPCLAMSGRQVGYIATPRSATWDQVAAEVILMYPDYRPVPPANAPDLIATDVEAINVVLSPGGKWGRRH